jgi:hypothetical protein
MVQFLAGEGDFYLLLKCQNRLWDPPCILFSGYEELHPWGQSGWIMKLTHSPTCSAKVKIVWGYTSNHNMCLLSMQKDSVIFSLLIV